MTERAQLLRDARTALEKHQYPEAVDLLTRLLRQPEYPARADAQELMGLVRERAGQLAQAKAEYEEYLRRYPGPARARRASAPGCRRSPRPRSPPSRPASSARPRIGRWTMAGSAALTYQYGKDQTVSAGTTTTHDLGQCRAGLWRSAGARPRRAL